MPPSRDTGRITRSQTARRGNVRRTRRHPATVLSNSPEPSSMDSTTLIATPPRSSIPVVDLDILDPPSNFPSSSNMNRRTFEVDLTCELDDKVSVVSEDIINPSGNSFQTSIHISTVRTSPAVTTSTNASRNCSLYSTNVDAGASNAATGIQCPICLDNLSQMKAASNQLHSTTCGHLFCHPCILRVISNTKQCPTCRQSLTVKKIHPIFI